MSYATQSAWREIQAFLPAEYQLGTGEEPAEEWWPWGGHEIHLDCYRDPDAAAKVILFHGVGTNGRQLSTILGAPLHRRGFETIAVDMPEYGVTRVAPGVASRRSPSTCPSTASPGSHPGCASATTTGCRRASTL